MSNSNAGNSNERRRRIEKRVAIFIGVYNYTERSLPNLKNDIFSLTGKISQAFTHVVTFTSDSLDISEISNHTNVLLKSADTIISYLDHIDRELQIVPDFQLARDLLWIHFSGHGSQVSDKWVFEIPGDSPESTFSDHYLNNWYSKIFTERGIRGRVLVTVAACRSEPKPKPKPKPMSSLSNSHDRKEVLIVQDKIYGMYLIGASPKGELTYTKGPTSDFVTAILEIIDDKIRDQESKDLTIRELRTNLMTKYPQAESSTTSSSGIEEAVLVQTHNLKPGKHNLLTVNTGNECLPSSKWRDKARFSLENGKLESWHELHEVSKDIAGKQPQPRAGEIPLFLYWSGRARTVGFHLFINEKESINLQEFVKCLNATEHKTIVLWLDCQFIIQYNIKQLWIAMVENRNKTLYIIYREESRQSEQGFFLHNHFERTTEKWYTSDPQEGLGSLLSKIATEYSVHVYSKPETTP